MSEQIITGYTCLEYDKKESAIGWHGCGTTFDDYGFPDSELLYEYSFVTSSVDRQTVNSVFCYPKTLQLLNITGRKCGYIKRVNSDGSHEIALMGNGTLSTGNYYQLFASFRGGGTPTTPPLFILPQTSIDDLIGYSVRFNNRQYYQNSFDIPKPTLLTGGANSFLRKCGSYNGVTINQNSLTNIPLSTDTNLTLIMGISDNDVTSSIGSVGQQPLFLKKEFFGNFFDNWSGDLYSYLMDIYSYIRPTIVGLLSQGDVTMDTYTPIESYFLNSDDTYAYQYLPFNIILTHNYSEAVNYINNGTLPSDAFLYPFEGEDSFKPYDPTSTPDGGDYPNETGEENDDVDDTPLVVPSVTPSMLNTNNLYWLEAGELDAFIQWFWLQAGEIIDINDLWQKIEGLYTDLASAIINIRYMPINIDWIGGVTNSPSIIVGQIEKTQEVNQLKRNNPIIRDIGRYSVTELYQSFADYSPYTNAKLFLPYHGFVELDIDFLMNHDIVVKAIYDYISGTIQYYIFRDDTLINSIIAKMAVDIPITLQSKGERDSAIIQNVGNATASIMGATTSSINGNPIGLTMATTDIVSGGAQSAPFKVLGTMEESGAFYSPNKCAIYIQHPRYNRPNNYNNRVGFPFNKGYKLKSLHGFTVCYNPNIDFSNNMPLSDEIDEIYTLLEEGVIL